MKCIGVPLVNRMLSVSSVHFYDMFIAYGKKGFIIKVLIALFHNRYFLGLLPLSSKLTYFVFLFL